MWIQTITCLLILSNFGYSDKTDDKTKFPQPYRFGYTVSDKTTGDFKTHEEVSDGREVRGRYSLVEPTGDLRVVTYTADRPNGFRAVVNVEPRSQTQPTPTYRLVKLQPLQKLRRQHDESTDTTSSVASATHEDDGQRGIDKPLELGSRNNTEKEQVMAVSKDSPVDKNVSQSEYQFGIRGEPFEKSTFDTDHQENAGPQIIPVKIEEDTPGTSFEVKEPVLKVDTSSVTLVSTEEVENVNPTQDNTTHLTEVKNNQDQMTHKNNTDQLSVIKSMVELQHSNKQQPTLQPSLENVFTTTGYLLTSQYQPVQSKNPDITQVTPTRNTENGGIQEKLKNNTNVSQITINNEGMGITDMKQNNMMLAALLLPTTPILKFTCTPDHSDKNKMPIASTMPNNAPMLSQRSPQLISLGPGGSVFTPGIPLFPFQLVNFSPIKQIFNTPQNNKFTPQKPIPVFATKPPFSTAFSTLLFQNTKPIGTAAPQQNTNIVQKDEDTLVKAKPPNGYTNLRTEGSASHAHKVQSSHYTHHLLPPPWAPHPLHPSHNPHYRHLPIFVLPMSHNFNFAPTFDPASIDQHNH